MGVPPPGCLVSLFITASLMGFDGVNRFPTVFLLLYRSPSFCVAWLPSLPQLQGFQQIFFIALDLSANFSLNLTVVLLGVFLFCSCSAAIESLFELPPLFNFSKCSM